MSFHPRVAPPLIGLRASSIRLILAMIAVLIAVTAAQIGLPGLLGQQAAFVDFHVFHLAGKLALSGNLAQAYHSADFVPLQESQPGFSAFMPYTYPPQFNLIAAPLALLPQALAYLAFVGGGFAAWLWSLNRLGMSQAGGAALMVLPAAVVCARYGQNGFLSAALIGGFCLWSLRGRALAGLPLGLMAYKPHLGVGIALATLLQARWSVIATATATLVLCLGAATLAFGPGIWGDFRAAAGESAGFLEAGAYPLFRMTSVYAALRSFGLEASLAMLVHGLVALTALLLLGRACLRRWKPARILALSVLCCLIVSPYNYDYDLVIAAVAVALAAPDLERTGAGERAALMAGLWLATGWGLLQLSLNSGPKADIPALGAFGFLLAFGLIYRALTIGEAEARAVRSKSP